MFLKPQKIIFNSIIQRYKLKDITPNQTNNNQELIDQLEIDIKLNGLLCPLVVNNGVLIDGCLLYTSPRPRDRQKSRMPSSA